ncbi:hypothetical protein CDD83_2215 [Cordyceps sp. RAO-2017]|nr:hypothetical protein CDD83_2215 [Cordyceps sp. RAO-2017]
MDGLATRTFGDPRPHRMAAGRPLSCLDVDDLRRASVSCRPQAARSHRQQTANHGSRRARVTSPPPRPYISIRPRADGNRNQYFFHPPRSLSVRTYSPAPRPRTLAVSCSGMVTADKLALPGHWRAAHYVITGPGAATGDRPRSRRHFGSASAPDVAVCIGPALGAARTPAYEKHSKNKHTRRDQGTGRKKIRNQTMKKSKQQKRGKRWETKMVYLYLDSLAPEKQHAWHVLTQAAESLAQKWPADEDPRTAAKAHHSYTRSSM